MVKILKAADVEFKSLGSKEVCCGYPLLLAGDVRSFKSQATEVIKLITDEGVDTVVTSCPGCYRCFIELYPKYLGGLPLNVIHSTQLILNLIKSGRLRLSKRLQITCTYHDPCDLGRHLGIYDAPRHVIESVPGVRYVEMERSREAARCCGGGGALRLLIPQLSTQVAITRVKDDVEPLGVDAVVTACPTCVKNLSDGASVARVIYGIRDINVMDITELVSSAIG